MARRRSTHRFDGIKHGETRKARARVLKAARKRGSITSAQAARIGKWNQPWYHLNVLRMMGDLKRDGYNRWIPR